MTFRYIIEIGYMEKNELKKDLYWSYINKPLSINFLPLVVGYEKCKSSKSVINSSKNCYVVHIIIEGKGKISTKENKIFQANKGDIFIMQPYSNFSYKPDKKTPWSYIWIEFNGEGIKALLKQINFSDDNFIYTLEDSSELLKQAIKMINEDAKCSEEGRFYLISAFLFKIFKVLTDNFSISHLASQTKQQSTVSRIIKYINIHYTEPDLTIEKIANEFYFTAPYLSRLFKSEMGVSPMQYVINLRMSKAIELIKHHEFTISQISETVGYKNQFYFSKEFKKIYDDSPSSYRKNIKGKR